MYNSLNIEIAPKMRKLFTFLKNYENCFDFKNAKTFSEHKNENYIINFLSSAESLYESLYIFFETKFEILRNYLLENLILNYIRKFTSCANTSMFFVFKKTTVFVFV